MKKSTLLILMAASAVLAACGGGDPEPQRPVQATDGVSASASASVPGLIAYLKALVVLQPNNLEPVSLSTFTPQTSNSTEPDIL